MSEPPDASTVNRRAYLGILASSVSAFAGCAVRAPGGAATSDSAAATPSNTDAETRQLAETELPVPRSELTYAGPRDLFPAIVEPAFGTDWSGISFDRYSGDAARPRLTPTDRIIGIRRNGEARAYPLRLLVEHEIVNDEFDRPLLVSYCHLCGSGVAAERVVDGEPAVFGVSGKLWNSDLVMYDVATKSYWSQLLATAIRGEHTGTRLSLVPSTLTTWGEWREQHPETVVLRPPPESETINESGPRFYTGTREVYRESDAIGIGENDFEDDRLTPKQTVIGVAHNGAARAYPFPLVSEERVINDRVGGRPIVVSSAGSTLVAYDRQIGTTTLRFERPDEETLQAGGSRWDLRSGRALGGPYEGQVLTRANDVSQLYWFAWAQHHPETTVYRRNR